MSKTAQPIPEVNTLLEMPRSERVQVLFNFAPTDYQAELLDYHENQAKTQAAPKKGRQVGASLVGSALAADYFVMTPDTDILITSPKQDPADELFEKFKQHFRNSDFSLAQFGVVSDNETTWRMSHGARALCRTLGQGELSQRSISPSFVIVDEAAYASDYHLEEVIEPFFITHSEYEFYLFSTPRGKTGYFYHAVEGNDSENWFSPHWPTEISPFADAEYLARKQKEKDSTTFAQEYLGEFADTGEVWIPSDLFANCVAVDPDRHGNATRFLGVDVARKGKDETVYIDIDDNGVLWNIWSEETSNISQVANRIKGLDNQHDYQTVLIDENSVGGGVVDAENLRGIVTGVSFTSKSKDRMYRSLKEAFEREELVIPEQIANFTRLEDQTTRLEFEFTQHGYVKVSHPPGGHDDYPDALALANLARTGRHREFTSSDTRSAKATFSW